MRTGYLFLVPLLALAGSVQAEEHVCRPAVEAAFAKYRIPAERVTITRPERRFLGSSEGVNVGYKFWLPIKDCDKGYLIIDFDLDCNIDQIFTSGPCKFPGVTHW
jgi:hypothetical protein